MGAGSPVELVGRDGDAAFVCGFVEEAAIRGGALLVSGDAGVGKTALLDVAARHAETTGTRVVRVAGAEFEADVSFSGLNNVLYPFLDRLASLPRDGRAGGAVTMSIHALALLGFDAFLTGQWDVLAELADEAVALCDTHGYGLLRWPSRSLRALLAAGPGGQRERTRDRGVAATDDQGAITLFNQALRQPCRLRVATRRGRRPHRPGRLTLRHRLITEESS